MIQQIVSYNKQETGKLTGSIVDLRAMSDLRCWPACWLNVVAPLVVDASVTVFYAICARSPDLSLHILEMNGESYRLKQSRRVSAMLSSD